MFIKHYVVYILLILLSTNLYSQNTYEFLRIDPSARASALGGSFVAVTDDPDVVFYNPSGIGYLTGNPISFSFVKHLLDINLASLSFSTELEHLGRFGAGIKYINYGTFEQADEFGNRNGEFGASELAAILGYSNKLDENFFYGINTKIIYSKIADRSSSAIALDLGINYSLPEEMLSFGFSILNFGTQLSSYYSTKEELPLDIVLGISKRLEKIPVRLSLDFHRLGDNKESFSQRFKSFNFGAELTLSKVLKLRVGYDNQRRSDLKIGTTAGIAGFNFGVGATISSYQFDYSYSSYGLIGALHRIGISTNLEF
ncbi:MAG: type IX secretion system protein PorQ [Ignavibacterium sp.]|nr:type IX secretion system protein PorQ [Ignavibacterium sp.]